MMKKWTVLMLACTALAGCHWYEADMDKAAAQRAERRAAYHQEFGCPEIDSHADRRQCILNTYRATKPRTYRTQNLQDGQPLAVIRDETKRIYDEDNNTYKTERVIVIETEERLEPLPAATALIPYTVEKLTQEEIETPKTVEEKAEPAETKAEEPVKEEVKAEPAVAKESSWWETRPEVEEPEKPKCPCEDPNDPCPQCVEK